MTTAAFFTPSGSELHPAPHAAATWDADTVHGRLLVGLLAREVEAVARGEGLRCARLTVDLLRPAPRAPLTVRALVVHRSRRSAAVDAEVEVGGTVTTRARALLLAPSEPPPGDVWSLGSWGAPDPADLDPISAEQRRLLPWDLRPVHGPELVTADRKAGWIRDDGPLVAGEVSAPFVRLATVADAANPLANSGTRGLRYINADLTLYLDRDPVGPWFGFDVASHLADAGVAVGLCHLHDRAGPLGAVATTALATRRPARHHRDGRDRSPVTPSPILGGNP